MELEVLPADYGIKCGELYLSDEGLVAIHCAMCPHQYDDYSKYYQHLQNTHITEYVKKEHEYIVSESEWLEESEQENVLEEPEVDIAALKLSSEYDKETVKHYAHSYQKQYLLQTVHTIDEKDHTSANDENSNARPNKQLGRIKCKYQNAVRKFKCTECNFSCKDKSNLNGHMKRHSSSKAFLCTVCDKDFHTTTELKAHFRRHTGEKPFLCTDCGRSFFTSSQLNSHVKRHKNQRDKECEICHKKFFDAPSLDRHLRVHTGYRPFKCTFPNCHSSFKRRNALDSHRKMHENKREYHCIYCPARFNQKCNLNAHKKNKHMIA